MNKLIKLVILYQKDFDEDFYETESISDEKFNECVKLLNHYKSLAQIKGTSKIYAYASPIFQMIKGSKKFFEDIYKKTNIFFTVLTNPYFLI